MAEPSTEPAVAAMTSRCSVAPIAKLVEARRLGAGDHQLAAGRGIAVEQIGVAIGERSGRSITAW
jgi:hypothetical protein